MAEEVQFGKTEEALVGVDDDAMSGEMIKHDSQVLKVLFASGAGYKDIIDICVGEREATQDLIHETLERLCCISEAERHSHKLKKTKWSCDGGLGYVCGGHRNLVICTYQIHFGKDRGTLQ